MNRKVIVLKMLILAIEERVIKGLSLDRDVLEALALQYGRGINLESRELDSFFENPVLSAIMET